METNNFQRLGSLSNAQVGRDFESAAQAYFRQLGVALARNFAVPIGVASATKNRHFDLGSADPPMLVECKSHRWTTGGNIPSAKITVWNEAMYYFHLAPPAYRKVLFVLRDFSARRNETLAAYYVRNYGHLVPGDVEILEYDPPSGDVFAVPAATATAPGVLAGALPPTG
jgi:hypothetical protein